MKNLSLILLTALLLGACVLPAPDAPNPFDGPKPWPEIRKERISTLLGPAMERAGIDA